MFSFPFCSMLGTDVLNEQVTEWSIPLCLASGHWNLRFSFPDVFVFAAEVSLLSGKGKKSIHHTKPKIILINLNYKSPLLDITLAQSKSYPEKKKWRKIIRTNDPLTFLFFIYQLYRLKSTRVIYILFSIGRVGKGGGNLLVKPCRASFRMVEVRNFLERTIVGDSYWHFDKLGGGHCQSQGRNCLSVQYFKFGLWNWLVSFSKMLMDVGLKYHTRLLTLSTLRRLGRSVPVVC